MSNDNQGGQMLRDAFQSFREMDNMVIEACVDARRRELYPCVSETDLQILRNAHRYRNDDYDTEDMMKYFTEIRHSKPIWDAAWRSLAVWLFDPGVQQYRKLWVTQIQEYGSQAWLSAVSLSVILATRQGDVKGSTSAVFDKFATMDIVLDQVYPDVYPGVERERFSDEYRDTGTLLFVSQVNAGPYVPALTGEQLQEAKAAIRRRRQLKAASDGTPPPVMTAEVNDVPSESNVRPRKWGFTDSTITAVVCIFTAAAVVPICVGWQYSLHQPGSKHDADFYFLLQGTIMQVMGVLTVGIPLFQGPPLPKEPWFWTWGFLGAGFLLSMLAIPAYLRMPTEWSALLSFLGSAAQGFVTLQLMFTIDRLSPKPKHQ